MNLYDLTTKEFSPYHLAPNWVFEVFLIVSQSVISHFLRLNALPANVPVLSGALFNKPVNCVLLGVSGA